MKCGLYRSEKVVDHEQSDQNIVLLLPASKTLKLRFVGFMGRDMARNRALLFGDASFFFFNQDRALHMKMDF